MASIFSKIINRELPAHIIAENDDFIAFLDVFPLVEGHVLAVPKIEIDKAFDLSDELLSKWLVFAKPIAKAIEKSFDCNRCGISIVGLEVPHAHMHLIPINSVDDLNFTRDKLKLSEAQLNDIKNKIIAQL